MYLMSPFRSNNGTLPKKKAVFATVNSSVFNLMGVLSSVDLNNFVYLKETSQIFSI